MRHAQKTRTGGGPGGVAEEGRSCIWVDCICMANDSKVGCAKIWGGKGKECRMISLLFFHKSCEVSK